MTRPWLKSQPEAVVGSPSNTGVTRRKEARMRVVNQRTERAPNAVYIGRGGEWGNPFPINKDRTREEAVLEFKQWLWDKMEHSHTSPHAIHLVQQLNEKDLACYCAPLACHGDVLVAAIKWIITQSQENQS